MRNKFTDVAIVSIFITAATIGLLWAFGVISILEGDDDRPPVVVSSGSVEIESQVDAKDEKRGDFVEAVSGDKKKWNAGHGKGKNPKSLTVIISNSTSGTAECLPTYVHKKITSVVFSYTQDDGTALQFRSDVGPDFLQLTFPVDAAQTPGEEYRLSIPGAKLTSVTIGGTTCDLGALGRVEMRQRK